MPPALAVAGPQLGAQNGAEKRTADHPSHDHRAFIIEPDEVRRTLPDPVAHRTVIAVDHPSLRLDRLGHAADEFLRIVPGQIAPSRLPVYGIQFDMRQLQECRNSACQRGLASARGADHHDPHQAASGMAGPTIGKRTGERVAILLGGRSGWRETMRLSSPTQARFSSIWEAGYASPRDARSCAHNPTGCRVR